MGVVYKARQIRLNRLCALKIILPGEHNGAEFRARFLAEAETIARLRHPNIVQIYGLGDHDGRPYFEMEYIEGGSLARRLDGTPWAPEPAARMVAVLARAIGDAHRLGIVHRDLKPANVLLVDDDTPKVVDFGLAKTLEADSSLTQSGVFVGTPSYAAPEQAEGLTKAVGPAADIYALGAIFYHMLTGRPPFQAATVLQTLEQVRTAEPVPPSRLQPGLSRDAETICLKCLEKDPQRRYADAAALAEDLDRYLAGRAILARPTGAVERFRKWIRRRPAVALLSAAVVAVTLLGFILVAWQWRRAEAKAVAEAAANARAQQARLVAFEKQAQLTFHQALALCDQGEVGRGLWWLARSLELAAEAQAEGLERPIRINLADWASQLSRPVRLPLTGHSRASLGLHRPSTPPAACSHGHRVARRTPLGPELHLDTPVEAVALTPDGRRVIKGERAGTVHIWDAETERGFDLPPQGTDVTCLAVSPDGRIFATGTEGGVVRLWDTSLLGPIGQTCKLAGAVTAVGFDPDGRVLAIRGDDGTIRLWEVPHQKALGFPLRVNHPVQTVTFGEDGRRLLIGTTEGARWWDLTGRMVCESGPGPRRSLERRAVEPGRGHGGQPRRSDLGDRAVRGGRGPDSRPGRAPGCGHGEVAPADARAAPRALGSGLQPRLEVAPDLGSRARNGRALGRGHLARRPPPLPVLGVPHPPGRLQPRRPDPAAGLPGWQGPDVGCGQGRGDRFRALPAPCLPDHRRRLRPEPLEGSDGLSRRHRAGLGRDPGYDAQRIAAECRRDRRPGLQPRRDDVPDGERRWHGAVRRCRIRGTARPRVTPHGCRPLRRLPPRRPECGDRHQGWDGAALERAFSSQDRQCRGDPTMVEGADRVWSSMTVGAVTMTTVCE